MEIEGEINQRSTTPTGVVQDTLTADFPRLLKTAGKVHALVLLPVKAATLLAPGRPSIFLKTQPEGIEDVDATVLKSSLKTVWADVVPKMQTQRAIIKSSFLYIIFFYKINSQNLLCAILSGSGVEILIN